MDRLKILLGKIKNNTMQPFLAYLSTPIAKITITNSVLFVFYDLQRHYGRTTMSRVLS